MFLDKMDVEEVKNIVRDSLGLDNGVVINGNVPIAKHGAERIDLADILFKAKAYDAKHLSNGEVNKQGRDFLINVGEYFKMPFYEHFTSLAVADSKDIFNELTPVDVSLMSRYKERVVA